MSPEYKKAKVAMLVAKEPVMLKITIQLDSAVTGKTTTIADGTIYNDGSGTKEIGNYRAIISTLGKPNAETTKVRGFPRLEQDAWDLLYRALRQMRGKANGK